MNVLTVGAYLFVSINAIRYVAAPRMLAKILDNIRRLVCLVAICWTANSYSY